MSRIATLFIGLVLLLSLTGCNTLHGAGQDIENAGESIQDAAED
ncbi:MAG: entericidin A/B family lipoprotein [Oceanicaulis sp.]